MDLDMSKVGAATATAPTPTEEFDLFAPPAVTPEVAQQKSTELVVQEPVRNAIAVKADGFVKETVRIDVNSPEFNNAIESIMKLGADEIRKTSEVSNRMLQRPAMDSSKMSPQTRVGGTLTELRNVVVELDPNRADLNVVKKFLKFLPGGNKIDAYFQKYRSAEAQINDIIKALAAGQDELRKDNAAIETENMNMYASIQEINKYAELTQLIDDAIVQELARLRSENKVEEANKIEADLLFAVRQRHTDLLTQKAVAVQGYMALSLIHKNNLELIKGVDRAQNTTLAALRTAVMVSQALGQQKLVLNQINAVSQATSDILVSTSEQLKTQAVEVQTQASSAMVDIESLKTAFANVYSAMDAIDEFRVKANDNMQTSITTLQGELVKADKHLERVQREQPRAISY